MISTAINKGIRTVLHNLILIWSIVVASCASMLIYFRLRLLCTPLTKTKNVDRMTKQKNVTRKWMSKWYKSWLSPFYSTLGRTYIDRVNSQENYKNKMQQSVKSGETTIRQLSLSPVYSYSFQRIMGSLSHLFSSWLFTCH